MVFRAISISLLLLAVLLPSHASEYRSPTLNNNPVYGYTTPTYHITPTSPPLKYKPAAKSPPPPPPKAATNTPSYTSPKPSSSLAYLFLKGQNAARAAVGLPPFSWDDKLAAYAQNWANQRLNDCALIHSNGPYGENIFWGSGDADWSPEQAVDSWVVERKYYDYYSNSCSYGEDCGHYTQIIWRDSTRIGCAKVTCNGGTGVFITCNYDPPGNYIGTRPY